MQCWDILVAAGFGRAGLPGVNLVRFVCVLLLYSFLVGLFGSFLVSRFCVLLVHGVPSPVLFISAADAKFRYGHRDGLDGKLLDANDV